MTVAGGSRARLAYVAEVTYGTTPTTPAFKVINPTKHNIGLEKDTYESATIRSDRQVDDLQHGVRKVSGDIGFEFRSDTFDDFLEAALMGTWSGGTLKAGTTRRSFSIERYFADIGRYRRATGCEINAFSLECPASGLVTGSFGVIGQNDTSSGSAVSGATYTDDPSGDIMPSVTGTITIDGSAVSVVTGVKLSLDNSIENLPVVGSTNRQRGAAGRSKVTGEVSAFYDSDTLLSAWENESEIALVFAVTDGTDTYTFTLPRIKFTGGKPDVAGEREVTLSLPFHALYSSGDASQIVIVKS